MRLSSDNLKVMNKEQQLERFVFGEGENEALKVIKVPRVFGELKVKIANYRCAVVMINVVK